MKEYLDDDLGLRITKPTKQQAQEIGSIPPPDEEPFIPNAEGKPPQIHSLVISMRSYLKAS